MALRSPSACKGNRFREWPGRSASPVAGLFCLFEVVGARLDGGGGASGVAPVASPAPDWGCQRLEWFGQRQRPDLPVVFPANGQGSGEIRLGLGQGGQRCLRLLEGSLILLAMGDQSVLIRGPLVHVGRRRVRQVGSVVQLLSLADDTVVEAPHLNPLCV